MVEQNNEKRLKSIPLKKVNIDDEYWNKYIKLVPEVIIPYQWAILCDKIEDFKSYCLQNFKIAAGEAEGERRGVVFLDSDLAKWLEAVSYSLETHPDHELEQTADKVILLLEKAQCEDGYLNTYYTLVPGAKRWNNLSEGHELYTAGHFIEAAVAYYEATGKDRFLKIMCRFADLICDEFGPGEFQRHGYPGHQEIELALVKLYHVTGNQRYLEMSKYFIDTRGREPNYFLTERQRPDYHSIFPEFRNYDPVYSQSDKPVREQTEAEGHAVRATYMYCAMADLAYEYNDEELLDSCKRLWNSMVKKRMYLTGSIGSSPVLERFTTDYDLPNDINYSETCASIGLALFGLRMAQITGESSYMDVVERALYNTVRAGISLEGNRFFYVNPLEVWPQTCMVRTAREAVKPVRQKWFDVACCPTNVARTLTSLAQYIYAMDEDQSNIYLNLFVCSNAEFGSKGDKIEVEVHTDFPHTSHIALHIRGSGNRQRSLHVRVPGYARNPRVFVNGVLQELRTVKGYAVITKVWTEDTVEFSFDMEACFVSAHPEVRADSYRVAIVRGCEVFCLEENDNGANLGAVSVSRHTPLSVEYRDELFGGCNVITLEGKRMTKDGWEFNELYREQASPIYRTVSLTAIPYAYWCNRHPGEMMVWLHCTD